MIWLLGRLGKVQLQPLLCNDKPSSNHLLCQSDRHCPCPDGRSLKTAMAKLVWCRSREDQRRDPEPLVPGSKGACLSSGNAEAHEGKPWSPPLAKRGLVLTTIHRNG